MLFHLTRQFFGVLLNKWYKALQNSQNPASRRQLCHDHDLGAELHSAAGGALAGGGRGTGRGFNQGAAVGEIRPGGIEGGIDD